MILRYLKDLKAIRKYRIETSWDITHVQKRTWKCLSTISEFFKSKGWKSRHVIQEIFIRETMKTRKAKNVFEAKFGSGEIMSSWETDDRRGDYLLYLHLLASTFLARALTFPFAFDLTTSLGTKKNYSNCLDPFKAQFVIKLLFFRG